MDDSGKLETVNVRLPDEIIKVLDSLVGKGLFSNRSEAIREFARQYINDSANDSKRGSGYKGSGYKRGGGR